MKRRVLSFIAALALCLNLCPLGGLAAVEEEADGVLLSSVDPASAEEEIPSSVIERKLKEDKSYPTGYKVQSSLLLDTNGFTLTGTGTGEEASAVQVTEGGVLYLKGKVVSENGAGVEVQSGGTLVVMGKDTVITGKTYGLDIAANAQVTLSAGTYTGGTAAIRVGEGVGLAGLLGAGCAYFNQDGTAVSPGDLASASVKSFTVGRCTEHEKGSFTHVAGRPSHTWTCAYCTTTGVEKCTFTFDENGTGTCSSSCGNTLKVTVDESGLGKLIYDGSGQTANVTLTVTLGDNTTLNEGNDYTVAYTTRVDAGEITVTVTGVAFNGTFTKTYQVKQDKPDLEWAAEGMTVPVEVNYDGSPVEVSTPDEQRDLPLVKINIQSETDDLRDQLRYSYRKTGTGDADAPFIDGLPCDAGEYEIKAYIPESQNFEAAETEQCLALTIKPIAPIEQGKEPAANSLTYNRAAQELVIPGTLCEEAQRDGLEIQFATNQGGPYTAEIPTGINAGSYSVWYRVEGITGNYNAVGPAKIENVEIKAKEITPTVELSQSSYPYDGTKKEPKVTVKDGLTVIEEDQYAVAWEGSTGKTTDDILRAVGKYTATISQVTGKNYTFNAVTATVEIVEAAQDALTITGKPDHVHYGDVITTLDTAGGTGNGTVTWSVTGVPDGTDITIHPDTGVLTVKDTGTVTVKAERTVPNYGPVSDTWTFTVEPKPVMAEVTVAAKTYDGTNAVADDDITATVKQSDLVNASDTVTLSGLTGAYDDANVGTGKTVTLNASAATADNTDKYAVSYPATAKGDITAREIEDGNVTVTLSGNDLKTEIIDGTTTYSYMYDGTAKTPNVTVTGTWTDVDNNNSHQDTLAASDYSVSYSNNKNASTEAVKAAVTVTEKAGGNYTFTSATVNFTIKPANAVLTSTPRAKDLTYTGQQQELVTVGTASGGHVEYCETENGTYLVAIPKRKDAGTYTVYYKVVGDGNHQVDSADSTALGSVAVTIKPKEITPVIKLSTEAHVYNGSEQKIQTVTVMDGADTVPESEYTRSYRDNINAGTATVIVSDNNGGNYIVNGTASFTITKAAPTFTAPMAKTMQYTGAPQALVTEGTATGGTLVYSLENGSYSTAVPTATEVGKYQVHYKVLGDANHEDTEPVSLTNVEIAKKTVTNPTISLSSETFQYNGSQQKPVITVYDDSGRLIPEHEYTVTIEGTNGNVGMVDVDTYTVTVTTPDTSNYVINNNTATFKIEPAEQETMLITGTKAQVFYGDVIQLDTVGGSASGNVTWEVEAANGGTGTGSGTGRDTITSEISKTGLLTVKDVGTSITVTATRSAGGNYKDVTATWQFTAAKKPVTAVLTVAPKDYDGTTTDVANITAVVKPSDLAFSDDSITITGLTGTFDDPNVGTNKTVTVNHSKVGVTGTNADKYDITYPATTTASILAVAATVTTAPTAASLTYDASKEQELVTAGAAEGGTMVYSLNGKDYAPGIPKAKNAGTYTVYYKVQGDGNHTDSKVGTKLVTISKQTVTPHIELTPSSVTYDGKEHKPAVLVKDSKYNVIPANEYNVVYETETNKNWTNVDIYTVKVTNVDGGNYIITEATTNFTITATAQAPLEITGKPTLVYYGDTFPLSTSGGSGNGTVTWESSDANVAEINDNGSVTVKGVGTTAITITATKAGGGNYADAVATYSFTVQKKPITAIVTAEDKVYDGKKNATLHVSWAEGALVGTDNIDTTGLTGTFADEKAGKNKTVTVTCTFGSDATTQKYQITVPATTTASILKADQAAPNLTEATLTYNGAAQALVTGGNANSTLYSDTRDGAYSATVPTGTNAGTYTVWYKEQGDANHNESAPKRLQVTINPKTLTFNSGVGGTSGATIELSGNDLKKDPTNQAYYYVYDGTEKTPTVIIKDGTTVVPASEYTVSYSNNKNVSIGDAKAAVTVTAKASGNYSFTETTVNFTIKPASALLTSTPQAKDLTYTGQAQDLVTVGTASGGHLEYALEGAGAGTGDGSGTGTGADTGAGAGTGSMSYNRTIPTGTNAGTYVVHYRVVGDSNHTVEGTDSTTAGSVTVTIKPKEVISPKITVSGTYTYDGTEKKPGTNTGTDTNTSVTVEDGSTTILASEYTLSYRDNINAGTATVIVSDNNGGNYTVNGTASFTIEKAGPDSNPTPPTDRAQPYNGTEQELVTAGSASGGTMVYALNENGPYSSAIPKGKAKGDYTVHYKVRGDSNHKDSAAQSVLASITVNKVTTPTIKVTPEQVTYNGRAWKPEVTIKDDRGCMIDSSEYTVTYTNAGRDVDGGSNDSDAMIDVGKYTLTITAVGGNYDFTGVQNTATFVILPADQKALTITGTRERVYYGDIIQLSTAGGSGNGTVTWSVEDPAGTAELADAAAEGTKVATIDANTGALTITGVGPAIVKATCKADGYNDQTATWPLYAYPKQVTAWVKAEPKTYDGKKDAEVTAGLQGSDLVGDDSAFTIT